MSRRQKMIEESAGGAVEIHVTDREGLALVEHVALGGTFAVEGHGEIAQLFALFEELDLMAAYNALVSGVQLDQRVHGSPASFDVYKLTPQSMEYLLTKVTAGKMHPRTALSLAELIQRCKDAKIGAYKAPQKGAAPKAV